MINEGSIFIQKLADTLVEGKTGILVSTSKFAEGLLKDRVFNRGGNTAGGTLGSYKDKTWIKIRNRAGRQTGYVDLKYTGKLMNSIKTGVDGKDAVLYIDNDKCYLIAQGQEEQRGIVTGVGFMEIWNLTDDEKELVLEYAENLIDELIDKL